MHGQHRDAVLSSFTPADGDLAVVEVQVLHAQAQGFREAEAGAVEQARHETWDAFHVLKDAYHLRARKHQRQALWLFCSNEGTEGIEV